MIRHDLFVGMDRLHTAMLCAIVDPDIRTVLVRGPQGTGKSEFIRSICIAATGDQPRSVPQNSTSDRIFGSLDLEALLRSGETEVRDGILVEAGDGMVVLDDVDLMDRNTVGQILESVVGGRVVLEREGVSSVRACSCTLVATADSGRSAIDRDLLDMFDMCVNVTGLAEPGSRSEASLANLSDVAACGDSDLMSEVSEARDALRSVEVGDLAIRSIAEACETMGVAGHRGGISAARTARALAALDGRSSVSADNVEGAVALCLEHRRRHRVRKDEPEQDRVELFGDSHMRRFIHDERKRTAEIGAEPEEVLENEGTPAVIEVETEDVILDIGEEPASLNVPMQFSRQPVIPTRHSSVGDSRGRYVSARQYDGGSDIAIDATVRHAAPYQNLRGGDRLVILPSDLMSKVRQHRSSNLFMFVIDNSGSLVIRSRMRAVKATVLSVLSDHHRRGDSVAVVTFNEAFVGFALRPTRSVGCVRGILDGIPAGRRTPLSEAVLMADSEASMYARGHPADRCFVILMTDGGANVPMVEGADPFEETLAVASRARHDRVEWTVIDTSASVDPEMRAERLAERLCARYHRMDSLNTDAGP